MFIFPLKPLETPQRKAVESISILAILIVLEAKFFDKFDCLA